jgi:hypothetical protein
MRLVPHSELVLVQDVGHNVQLESFRQVSPSLLRFIRQGSLAGQGCLKPRPGPNLSAANHGGGGGGGGRKARGGGRHHLPHLSAAVLADDERLEGTHDLVPPPTIFNRSYIDPAYLQPAVQPARATATAEPPPRREIVTIDLAPNDGKGNPEVVNRGEQRKTNWLSKPVRTGVGSFDTVTIKDVDEELYGTVELSNGATFENMPNHGFTRKSAWPMVNELVDEGRKVVFFRENSRPQKQGVKRFGKASTEK